MTSAENFDKITSFGSEHMKEYQDGIFETEKILFESQNDYLRNYTQHEAIGAYYSGRRNKKGLSVGGTVTVDDLLDSIDRGKSDMNNKGLTDVHNASFHGYCEKINTFLSKISVDSSIFKEDRKYIMTESLVNLFDYILDDIKGAVSRIGRGRFNKVSMRERAYIFDLVEAAIRVGPASKEEKRKAVDELIEKGVCCPMHFEYYKNQMVDAIMDCTREAIVEVGWNPGKEKKVWDIDWEIVVERAYIRLFNEGILEINTENKTFAPGSKLVDHKIKRKDTDGSC